LSWPAPFHLQPIPTPRPFQDAVESIGLLSPDLPDTEELPLTQMIRLDNRFSTTTFAPAMAGPTGFQHVRFFDGISLSASSYCIITNI
jgi:hypothetical protein